MIVSGARWRRWEKEYIEPQLRAYFLWPYPNRTIVTNTFAVQDRGPAACGRYAVLVGQLFVEEEGSVEETLARLRDLFSGDTLANDERVVDLVPVVLTVAVQRGCGDPDDSGYASDGEKPAITSQISTTVQRVIGVVVLPHPS